MSSSRPNAPPETAPIPCSTKVDVFIEQADQIDVAGNAFLKGIRAEPVQPDLIALRALLAAADRVVVVADGGDAVSRLGASLPVAIVAEGWEEPAEELDDMFLGDAELWWGLGGVFVLSWHCISVSSSIWGLIHFFTCVFAYPSSFARLFWVRAEAQAARCATRSDWLACGVAEPRGPRASGDSLAAQSS
jgi:hypothetical protein